MPTTAKRVATRYRIIKRATTYLDALAILGFSSDERPEEAEVQKAYRARVVKIIRANPSEAADQKSFIPLNLARDTLLGKDRRNLPPMERGESDVGDSGFGDSGFGGFGGPMEKPEPVRITFQEALSDAGVHQVKWKFKTATSYGGFGDTQSSAFVIYGVDDETHVFVAAQHFRSRNAFTGEDVDTWWMVQRKVRGDFKTLAPRMIRELYEEFPHDLKKGYGAKVNILPEDAKFTEQVSSLRLKPVAFKDAVGILGLVGEDDAWRTNRKRDIRLEIIYGKQGEGDPIVITVNGRDFKLSLETSKLIEKKGILKAIFGAYWYPGSHKVITKMRGGGKPILKALGAVVDSPAELKEVLVAASAEEAA
jgi:hypothetical protein